MLKSVTRVVSKASNPGQRNVYRETPKTRFNANDRSASSPRLKSFPAEQIRRTDPLPIQKSLENANPSRQIVNSGQGDASQDFQNAQLSRGIPNQNISSTSEPRVFQSSYPTENHANQSQPMIPSNRVMENSTIERPPHRPYVPYGHHPPNAVNYPSANGTQGMMNPGENLSGRSQPSLQPQYYYQQNTVSNQMSQQLGNQVKFNNEQMSQSLPQIPNPNLATNGSVGKQQMYQQQRDQIPNQIVQQPPNNIKMENSAKNDTKKKPLKFTPAMIRDQELLVATMRQQGINEDIMRRQFEALLTEQRKQLLYLEALENPEIMDERKALQGRRVQRRISKIEEDGKPEWMLHITPPRIPYAVWEKIQAERLADSRVSIPNQQTLVDNYSANQIQHQANGNCQHAPQQSHQHSCQMSGSNISQQQPQYSYVPNNNSNVAMNQYQHMNHSYPVYHQQQQQQQPNPSMNEQQVQSENHPNTQNDDRKNTKKIAPSSLLQLRIYKEVIRRQKQNNGLQDAETIKEAMEALKNPANREGLEYLENLSKKREKPVPLNGVQDPQEMGMPNQYETYVCHQPSMKSPSANGLANSRNPNNPPPRETLRQKKIDQGFVSEYPVQKTKFNYREYCSPAERENGTTAMTNNNPNFHGTHGNPNEISKNTNCPHAGYSQPAIVNDQKSLGNPTAHNQYVTPQNQQPQYYTQNSPNYQDNHGKHCNHFHPGNQHDRMIPKAGYFTNEMANQQFYDPRKHSDLCEPMIIGGIKYLARKPMYTQNSHGQYYSTHHGRNFNPTIPCQ